ncbi:YbjQ family protein [Lachnospiraceae bacterium NSJ-143]|nr:YbjQ family protein [Lachnospiraceae bacterium NSJ-143]
MILTTTPDIPGKEYDIIGIVKGCTVQSRNIGHDIGAGLKTIIGGEITGYTEMIEQARAIAQNRMLKEAEGAGADAVINIRYATSSVMQGASEILMYGTAVKFK